MDFTFLDYLVNILALLAVIGGIYLVLILAASYKAIRNCIRKRFGRKYPCCKFNHLRKDMDWVSGYGCESPGPGKKVGWRLPILPYTREQLEEMVTYGDAIFLYNDKKWCWIDQVDLTNMCVLLTPYDSSYTIRIKENDRIFFQPASEFERQRYLGYAR
jgi:hypothetical protein